MKSKTFSKAYLLVAASLGLCFILEATLLSQLSKGTLIGVAECIIGLIAATASFYIYKTQNKSLEFLLMGLGFVFFALADIYWTYLFYVIHLPRDHWISVSLTQFPYSFGYLCFSGAIFKAMKNVRETVNSKHIWLSVLAVILPFFIRFILVPTIEKWSTDGPSYFLIGFSLNAFSCSLLIYLSLVATICGRDIFWGLVTAGTAGLVLENWGFRAESLLTGKTPEYGFYDFVWAFGIGTAAVSLIVSAYTKQKIESITAFNHLSLVNRAKYWLILSFTVSIGILTLFVSPNVNILRYLTLGTLLVITVAILASQYFAEKIGQYALLMTNEVADELGVPKENQMPGLPIELEAIVRASFKDKLNEKKLKDENQKRLSNIAAQVAHDIRSPLAVLDLMYTSISNIQEDKRIAVSSSINRIRDIANSMLAESKKISENPSAVPEALPELETTLLFPLIDSIVSEKRIQLRDQHKILINFFQSQDSYGIFCNLNPNELKRALSNIINNSIEALKDGEGVIDISLNRTSDFAEIKIQDSGIGIPAEVLSKVGKKGNTFGKSNGNGLGLSHAMSVAEQSGGSLLISSKQNFGTSISIRLPFALMPKWFIPKIELNIDQPLIVFDDDKSIHHVWSERLKTLPNYDRIPVFNFSSYSDLKKYYGNNFTEIDNATFLMDFEIVGSSMDGLEIIEMLGIQSRSVLVTSRHEDIKVKERCERLGVRLLPKPMSGIVPLEIC